MITVNIKVPVVKLAKAMALGFSPLLYELRVVINLSCELNAFHKVELVGGRIKPVHVGYRIANIDATTWDHGSSLINLIILDERGYVNFDESRK